MLLCLLLFRNEDCRNELMSAEVLIVDTEYEKHIEYLESVFLEVNFSYAFLEIKGKFKFVVWRHRFTYPPILIILILCQGFSSRKSSHIYIISISILSSSQLHFILPHRYIKIFKNSCFRMYLIIELIRSQRESNCKFLKTIVKLLFLVLRYWLVANF